MKFNTFLTRSQLTLPLLASRDTGSLPVNHTASLISAEYGTTFNADVTFGNQTFKLLVDTGSSDTYVVKDGFACIDSDTNLEIPRKECMCHGTYTQTSTYRSIPDQIFGVQYGNGIASGVMAHEDVTLAGITVPGQTVGIATRSNPMGDTTNSGVLGLAYPSLTSAHAKNQTNNETYWYHRETYTPLLNSMYEQGLIEEPYFSVALAHTPRDNSSTTFGGYLTLGDLPPVAHDPDFATVPVEILDAIPKKFTSGKRTRSYWAFTVSAVTYGNETEAPTTNSTKFQVFTDTGNDFSILPSAVVDPINAQFDPPAKFNSTLGASLVDCNAKAPTFGVEIGGQMFYHKGEDLIFQVDDGICVSGLISSDRVASGGIGIQLNILGVPFLKNVVAVHDFGKHELRFAQRLD